MISPRTTVFRHACVLATTLTAALMNSRDVEAIEGVASADQRPNVLFVLTDDQAPWAWGSAVRSGQYQDVPAASTPNMDALAKSGAVFTNFFCTTPVCSPARVAIATGRYASEFGIQDFIPSPDHKLFDPQRQVALDTNQSTTFAELLQSAGFRTGLVGKWHLGDWTQAGNEMNHPTHHGYDYFMGLTSGGTSPNNPTLEKNGQIRKFQGLTTDILTDHAIEFLDDAANGSQPFLLCVHTRAPHGSWLPVADEDWAPYDKLDAKIPDYPGLNVAKTKKDMREYLASTSGVDRNLGRLLTKLDELGIAENTIVIFTSDHGYNMGHNGIRHKGNGIWATEKRPPGKTHHGTRVISTKYRPNLYDLSLKVPAIVRWPSVTKPGTVISETATHLDLFPTLLRMTQIKESSKPNEDLKPRQGRDLTPLLKGDKPTGWDQDLVAEYDMINYVTASMRCYRTPRYKLVRDSHNDGRDEFFDLVVDPSESNNLIQSEDPNIQLAIKRLDTALKDRMADTRPNVILILADDLCMGDLGSINGHPTRTPNLDRLAAQSVTFTQAYSGSCVCAPARASLLTGRYPHRTGVVTLNMDKYPKLTRLQRDEVTIAGMLGDAGYATGLIGKWHCGRGEGFDPLSRGFAEFEGFEGSHGNAFSYFDYPLFVGDQVIQVNDKYLTEDLSERAIEFVRRHQDERFFLHLAHYAPHRPLEAPREFVQKYLDQGFNESIATIYAMIQVMDQGIGDLLAELDSLGLAKDTVVIFASDNGPDPVTGERFNRNLRGTKYQVHEGGIRVPLFVRWPGRFAPAQCDEPVHFVDMVPTIREFCGVTAPPSLPLDGESLVELAAGKPAALSRKLFWQWNRGLPNYTQNAALRQGKYKLVRPYVTRGGNVKDSRLPPMLIDLQDDPDESQDCAKQHPKLVRQLDRSLQQLIDDVEGERKRDQAGVNP